MRPEHAPVPAVFVDTGAWIGVLHPRDSYHAPARTAYTRLLQARTRLVTTNLVVAETYAGLRRGAGAERALTFLDVMHTSAQIELVYATAELEHAARQILRQYRDHAFSYADAVSFAVMRAHHLSAAFAFDAHFRIAGFALFPAATA
jgi:predicted nucleic acid-binding protein